MMATRKSRASLLSIVTDPVVCLYTCVLFICGVCVCVRERVYFAGVFLYYIIIYFKAVFLVDILYFTFVVLICTSNTRAPHGTRMLS